MPETDLDVVLVRMDKIGDLVLSLPADEHPFCSTRRTHWFITKGLGLIAAQALPKRAASEFARAFSPFEFWRMVRWLRAKRPRAIVILFAPWWVAAAAWLAGVPERIGRLSHWHSFLFLNVRVKQKRSRADRHESDFNFDLIEAGANRLGVLRSADLAQVKRTWLSLTAPNPAGTLAARDLEPHSYVVVHPGMAGSALNWPPASYVRLIERLATDQIVVITGTKMDQAYLADVASVREFANVRWLVEQVSMSELLDLLGEARAVVAPSTGVVHLAASLGTPTVGIYSPRRVEHPVRWGPRGPRATAITPPAATTDMIHANVMGEISPDDVLAKLGEVLASGHRRA